MYVHVQLPHAYTHRDRPTIHTKYINDEQQLCMSKVYVPKRSPVPPAVEEEENDDINKRTYHTVHVKYLFQYLRAWTSTYYVALSFET